MLLSKKTRQTYLKKLGFYKGEIDGKIGPKTKKAYEDLQKAYFTRKKDIDGIYGKNTDILLRNAYNVKTYCENFKLQEFKCGCGGKHCTGYPIELNTQLLKNLQAVRKKFGVITITSGMRCKKHNASLVGSSTTSRHLKGKAVDIKCVISNDESGRLSIMKFWKTLPKWRYTYCNISGSHKNMGNAVHIDVK